VVKSPSGRSPFWSLRATCSLLDTKVLQDAPERPLVLLLTCHLAPLNRRLTANDVRFLGVERRRFPSLGFALFVSFLRPLFWLEVSGSGAGENVDVAFLGVRDGEREVEESRRETAMCRALSGSAGRKSVSTV
jgi:hypothetical protein